MKFNISYPQTGQQKLIEINDEAKYRPFMDKHIGEEVEGSSLGDEYKGYVFKISGGNDKQGFPMKQGILTSNRVRVLLKKGEKCYRPRRTGERKRKSVRGCITSNELCVLDLVIVKKGDSELVGITDPESIRPRRLAPKRAGKIRKLFSLTKDQNVCKFVARRKLEKKDRYKSPKIQRLVTPLRRARKVQLEHHKLRRALQSRDKLEQYKKMLAEERKHRKEEIDAKLRAKKEKEAERKKKQEAAEAAKKEGKPEKKAPAPKKEVKKEVKKETKKETTTKKALLAAHETVKPKKEVAPAPKAAAKNEKPAPKKQAKSAPAPKKAAPKKSAKKN